MPQHPQVRLDGLGVTCDAEIAGLIRALNEAGVSTLLSCQDNDGGRGAVRRVWVAIGTGDLEWLLYMLHRPAEAVDLESLSNRVASEYEPDDWFSFREDRAWHYDLCVGREDGRLDVMVTVRFPFTDVDEVVRRLAEYAGLALLPSDGHAVGGGGQRDADHRPGRG